MSGEIANHVVAEPVCVRFDDPADHRQRSAGLDGLDRTHLASLGALDEQPVLLGHIAGQKGGVGVAVHAVDIGGDVDVDDVAVLDTVESGMPWQMISFSDVQQDFGKPL